MSELKSITFLRQCVIISYIILITIVISIKGLDRQQILADLPTQIDFDYYLNVLEKTVDFYFRNKQYVDMNAEYALFLMEVNLKKYSYYKRQSFPESLRFRLSRLFAKNEIITNFFHLMVRTLKGTKDYDSVKKLTEMYYNTSTWSRDWDKFNTNLLKRTKLYNTIQLKKIYGTWDTYSSNTMNTRVMKPSFEETGECLEFLSRNPTSKAPAVHLKPKCVVPSRCRKMIKGGSEYGYGLIHRLLILIIGRFSRGCVLFSEKDDKMKTDKFCMRGFNEAQFIARHDFRLPIVIFEYIVNCGCLGHAQFYTNFWLRSLLRYQTTLGCFGYNLQREEGERKRMNWVIEREDWEIHYTQPILEGECDEQLTAAAIAALSNTLRYIMETYFID